MPDNGPAAPTIAEVQQDNGCITQRNILKHWEVRGLQNWSKGWASQVNPANHQITLWAMPTIDGITHHGHHTSRKWGQITWQVGVLVGHYTVVSVCHRWQPTPGGAASVAARHCSSVSPSQQTLRTWPKKLPAQFSVYSTKSRTND